MNLLPLSGLFRYWLNSFRVLWLSAYLSKVLMSWQLSLATLDAIFLG